MKHQAWFLWTLHRSRSEEYVQRKWRIREAHSETKDKRKDCDAKSEGPARKGPWAAEGTKSHDKGTRGRRGDKGRLRDVAWEPGADREWGNDIESGLRPKANRKQVERHQKPGADRERGERPQEQSRTERGHVTDLNGWIGWDEYATNGYQGICI